MVSDTVKARRLVIGANPEFSIIVSRYPEGIVSRRRRTYISLYAYAIIVHNIAWGFKQTECLSGRRRVVEIVA